MPTQLHALNNDDAGLESKEECKNIKHVTVNNTQL